MATRKAKSKLRTPQLPPAKGDGKKYRPPPVNYEALYKQETHRDWNLLLFEEQQKYVEQKVAEAAAMSVDQSQQASGLATLVQPTPITMEGLARVVYDLGQALGALSTNVTNLTHNVMDSPCTHEDPTI